MSRRSTTHFIGSEVSELLELHCVVFLLCGETGETPSCLQLALVLQQLSLSSHGWLGWQNDPHQLQNMLHEKGLYTQNVDEHTFEVGGQSKLPCHHSFTGTQRSHHWWCVLAVSSEGLTAHQLGRVSYQVSQPSAPVGHNKILVFTDSVCIWYTHRKSYSTHKSYKWDASPKENSAHLRSKFWIWIVCWHDIGRIEQE